MIDFNDFLKESEFLPKDYDKGTLTEDTIQEKLAQIEEARKEFLETCGYRQPGPKTLFIKSDFILNGKGRREVDSNSDMSNIREAILMIVADQRTLFLEGSGRDTFRFSHSDFQRNVKQESRKNSDDIAEEAIQACLNNLQEIRRIFRLDITSSDISSDIKSIVEKAVRELVQTYRETSKQRVNMMDWLCQKVHLAITDSNRAIYEKWCRSVKIDFPEELTDKDMKRIIKELKTVYHGVKLWMVAPEKVFSPKTMCRFNSLGTLGNELCTDILIYGMAKYSQTYDEIKHQGWIKGWNEVENREQHAVWYNRYVERLKVIKNLEELFQAELYKSKDSKIFRRMSYYPEFKECDNTRGALEQDIANRILNFYDDIKVDIIDPTGNIKRRVSGLYNDLTAFNDATREPKEKYIPILCLLMVLSCKKKIVSGIEIEIKETNNGPIWLGQNVKRPRQRFEEIRLVRDIGNILREKNVVHLNDLWAGWNEYVKIQGAEIRSVEEADLWREILKENYDKLPVISFQLLYIDYCAECIPEQYQYLPYNMKETMRTGGKECFYNFYNDNIETIDRVARQLKENDDISYELDCYKKIWFSGELRSKDRREKVSEIGQSLFKKGNISIGEEDERWLPLLTEVLLQSVIRRQAHERLLRDFHTAYGLSLKDATETVLSSE